MEKFEVGGRFTLLAGKPEGTFFEITASGPVWFFNYASPTDQEISDISEGNPFEIRTMLMNDVLWVFIKCGSQEWAEAPYNPHLSKSPELQPVEDSSGGYAMTLIMVDAETQIIRHIRMVGLGNRFSRQLKRDVEELLSRPFNRQAYDIAIMKAQTAYTSAQMAKNCRNYWRLR